MPRFAVRPLDEIPSVPEADFRWFPLQHHFGLTTFGANLFVANEAGDELVAEHDESASGHEELYLVLRGAIRFQLDDEAHHAAALSVVAVTDPAVRRRAVALEAGATLLAVGAPPGTYVSTWRADWFDRVPKLH